MPARALVQRSGRYGNKRSDKIGEVAKYQRINSEIRAGVRIVVEERGYIVGIVETHAPESAVLRCTLHSSVWPRYRPASWARASTQRIAFDDRAGRVSARCAADVAKGLDGSKSHCRRTLLRASISSVVTACHE